MLEQTTRASLWIQMLTWLYQWKALWNVRQQSLLWGALWLESIVQIIEALAYTLLISWSDSPANMMLARYADWFLTTPTMLVSMLALQEHYNDTSRSLTWTRFLRQNKQVLRTLFLFNFGMLMWGLIARVGWVPRWIGWPLSWLCFFVVFGILARKGLTWLWTLSFAVWSGYGVAEYLPDTMCNIMINVLDIFAKNVLGLLLSFQVLNNK